MILVGRMNMFLCTSSYVVESKRIIYWSICWETCKHYHKWQLG